MSEYQNFRPPRRQRGATHAHQPLRRNSLWRQPRPDSAPVADRRIAAANLTVASVKNCWWNFFRLDAPEAKHLILNVFDGRPRLTDNDRPWYRRLAVARINTIAIVFSDDGTAISVDGEAFPALFLSYFIVDDGDCSILQHPVSKQSLCLPPVPTEKTAFLTPRPREGWDRLKLTYDPVLEAKYRRVFEQLIQDPAPSAWGPTISPAIEYAFKRMRLGIEPQKQQALR